MNLENKVNMLVDSYLAPAKLSPKNMCSRIQDAKNEMFQPYLIRTVFNAICPKLLKYMDEEQALGVLESILNGYINIPNMEYLYNIRDVVNLVPTIDMLYHINSITNNISYLFNKIAMYKRAGADEIIILNIVPFLILSHIVMDNLYKVTNLRDYVKLIFTPLVTPKEDTDKNNIIVVIDDYEHTYKILKDIGSKVLVLASEKRVKKLLSKKLYLKTLTCIKNVIYGNKTSSYVGPKIQLLYPVKKMRNIKAPEFLKLIGVKTIPQRAFINIHTNRDVYNLYLTYREMSVDMMTFEEFEDKFIPFCDGNPDGFQVKESYFKSRHFQSLKDMPFEITNVPDYYYELHKNFCYSVCIDMERVMEFCKDLNMLKNMIYDLYLNAQYVNLAIVSSLQIVLQTTIYVHFINTDNETQKYIHQIVESVDLYLKDKYKYKITYKHYIINKYGRVKA